MIPINFVKPIRQQHGLTLRDLETLTMISKSTLGRIERMEVDPKLSDVIIISHALGYAIPLVFNLDYESLNNQ